MNKVLNAPVPKCPDCGASGPYPCPCEDGPECCPRCDGDGALLVCWDDMCQGQGYCIHGDGEVICHDCGGAGEL